MSNEQETKTTATDDKIMTETTSDGDCTTVEQRGNQCEMPECESHDDVKAVRDPDSNLLDMCSSCRSAWPVEVLE